jgi:phosphohistidine phosphatase
MKRVYLLRHGKTEKESDSGRDFDRALKSKGEAEVQAVSRKLGETGVRFDLLLSSSAPRAAESARIAAEAMDGPALQTSNELYDADMEDFLRLLQGLDETVETVMLVGHNPGIEDTVEAFLGKHRKVGTSNIMWLEMDCSSWDELNFDVPVLRSGLIVPG